MLLRHPVHRIKRVVEKMRIYLRLQGFKLPCFLTFKKVVYVRHKIVNRTHHRIERLVKFAYFIVVGNVAAERNVLFKMLHD